jgi:NifB/MoaA-like Fe-S oxidoreductase
MLRLMESEFRSAVKLADEPDYVDFSIATGVSAAPFFEGLLEIARERFPKLRGRVYAIENDFFGHSINVAGLVTGGDLINQLKGKELGERLFISQNMLRRKEQDFLDDVKLEEASAALGVPIYPTEADGFDLCDAIFGILPELPAPERGDSGEKYYMYNQNT